MNKMSGGGPNMMFGMGKSNAKIYVPSEEVRQIVEEKLEKYDIDFPPPYVNVMKQWFNC